MVETGEKGRWGLLIAARREWKVKHCSRTNLLDAPH